MSRKKIIIGIVIVAVLFGLGLNSWRTKSKNNGKITTAKVIEKEMVQSVSSSGKTKAEKAADLKFPTAGQLTWIGVKEGDHVETYQAIASLDSRELKKNLEKALMDYSKERNDFEEDRLTTYKDKVVTDTVKRILEKNQWDLDKTILDLELKDIALKWATLTTPISGIVTHIDTPVAGVYVTSTNVITVVDPSSIIFSANVDEVDVGKITVGQPAEIELDAYPDETFAAKVTKIAYSAELSSGGATVFPVELTMTNQPPNLRLGLNGDVSIVLSRAQNTLTVPSEAVKDDTQQKYVVKKVGQKFVKQVIKSGIANETETQIVAGLAKDEEIVVKGFQFLPKNLKNGQ